MTYEPDLASAWAKYWRGADYVDSLRERMVEQRGDDFLRVPLDRHYDADIGAVVFTIGEVLEVEADWSLIVGDAIHNFRGALDHLAWQLATRHLDGVPPTERRIARDVQFPIVFDETKWANHRHTKYMSREDAKFLRKFQPLHAKEPTDRTAVGVLAVLSNTDKHQAPSVLAAFSETMNCINDTHDVVDLVPMLDENGVGRIAMHANAEPRRGDWVARVYVEATGPKPSLNMTIDIHYDIFVMVDDVKGPVLDVLENINEVVQRILAHFEPNPEDWMLALAKSEAPTDKDA